MKLYDTNEFFKKFTKKNPDIPFKQIKNFFSDRNIFDNLSVKTFYTLKNDRSVYINENDAQKICLLAKLKFSGDFELSFAKQYELNENFQERAANNSIEVKEKMIEYFKTPEFVAYTKELKEIESKKRIHNQDFSRNAANYNIDINNKKIVSIDFEYDPSSLSNDGYKIKNCSECGISIYENNTIKHLHYFIEDGSHKTGRTKHLVNKFEFGNTKSVKSSELIEILNDHLKDADFMLAHGMELEYTVIIKNGIDIHNNNTQLLDTSRMFKSLDTDEILNSYRLKDIMRTCGMDSLNVHNAGNDAAYTLKTFLEMNNNPEMIKENIINLAVKYKEDKTQFRLKM